MLSTCLHGGPVNQGEWLGLLLITKWTAGVIYEKVEPPPQNRIKSCDPAGGRRKARIENRGERNERGGRRKGEEDVGIDRVGEEREGGGRKMMRRRSVVAHSIPCKNRRQSD